MDLFNLQLKADATSFTQAARAMNAAAAAAGGVSTAAQRLARQNYLLSQSTNSVVGSFVSLRNALVAVGIFQATRHVIQQTDALTRMDAKLRLVTTGTANLAKVQGDLFRTAQETRTSMDDTVTLYARMARSTEQYGTSQKDVLAITKLTNQAFQIGGATAAEAAGAVVQFGQALASNRLGGDELRSLSEQAPRLFTAIIEGVQKVDPALGLTRDNIRKFAKEGLLTTELMTAGLLTQIEKLGAEYTLMPRTVAQALTQLQNQFQQAFRGTDTTEFKKAIDELAKTVSDPKFIEALTTLASAILTVAKYGVLLPKIFVDIGTAIGEGFGKVAVADLPTEQLKNLLEMRDTFAKEGHLRGVENMDKAISALVKKYKYLGDAAKESARHVGDFLKGPVDNSPFFEWGRGTGDDYKPEKRADTGAADRAKKLADEQLALEAYGRAWHATNSEIKDMEDWDFDPIDEAIEKLVAFEDKNFGGNFAAGFDNASRSLAEFVNGFDELIDASEYYAKSREKYKDSAIDIAKIEESEQRTQIKLYGNLTGAAKGFFSEGSKGYKALEAAETAFRAVELALAIKSLFVKAQIAVANQANGDPYTAWARMAAMAAAMAALGAYVGGGGAGRRANAQSNLSKGQGTTLGDPSAVSESIAKSVEITANASEKLVGINYAMLSSLRALESQATGVGNVALREGINVPGLSRFSPFGVTGSGIQLPAQTFAKLIGDPIVNAFAQGTYHTDFAQAGSEISTVIRKAFGNISDTVMAGAMTLGMTEAQVRAAFGNIQMPEFRIDTQGMSGEQINEAFNKWLSAVFDQVAIETLAAGGVDLKNFAVGAETWAETMARLVVEVSVLNDAYTAMHIPMTATIELADEMARAFGGVEQMLEGFSMFVDLFFSDQEKNDLLRGQLGKGFAALGQHLPETKAAFRAMVEAALAVGDSDLVSGLLAMQEPFVKLIEGVEDAAGEVNKLVSSLRDLRDEAARHVAATQAPSVQLGRLRSQFQSQSALAGLGNSEAAALLPALGKDFMSASLQFAGSQSEYIRDLAMIQIGAERAAQAQERPRMTAFAGAAAGSFDTAPVVNEVQMLRQEVKEGLYAVAKNTAQMQNWMQRWDGDGMPEVREA